MSDDYTKLPRLSLTPDAQIYLIEVEGRRRMALNKVRRLPMAVLIWGPSPAADSEIAKTRVLLRDELVHNGHVAEFSEDLLDPDSGISLPVQ